MLILIKLVNWKGEVLGRSVGQRARTPAIYYSGREPRTVFRKTTHCPSASPCFLMPDITADACLIDSKGLRSLLVTSRWRKQLLWTALIIINTDSITYHIYHTNNFVHNQKHFLWTIEAPVSWYSLLVIHMVWNVEREDKMEPPIQTKNFLSMGATTLIFIVEGASWVTSLLSLSGIPGNMVLPPLITMLE